MADVADEQGFGADVSVSRADIVAYWDGRADGYSSCVCEELAGSRYREWGAELAARTASVRDRAAREQRAPRVLDLGCGPGFFSILFARMGCAVDAVDASAEMIKRARENNRREGTDCRITFHEHDICDLPFADATFDIIALRNVTWLMRDLKAAYREWQRVLAPGGVMLSFDANWYAYLADEKLNSDRIAREAASGIVRQDVNGHATDDQESACERIARSLPTTYLSRPGWDIHALDELGFSKVDADEEVWRRVWTADECAFYGGSPLFVVEAVK